MSWRKPFAESPPDVQTLTITIEESGEGIEEWNRRATYGLHSDLYHVCKNPVCSGRRVGLDLNPIVEEMIAAHLMSRHDFRICKGIEEDWRCGHVFNFAVSITYKPKARP
jgi:hypothetical protein